METKVLEKLNKYGYSIITQKEKNELISIIEKQQKEIEKQKYRNEILEELSNNNMIWSLKIDRIHNELLEEHLKEADKKFEKAKYEYVNNKIDYAEVSLHQGYYNALADLKRESVQKWKKLSVDKEEKKT